MNANPNALPDLAEARRLETEGGWPNPNKGAYIAAIAAHMTVQGPKLAAALSTRTAGAWTWSQSGASDMGDPPRGWLTRAPDGFALVFRPVPYRHKLEAATAPLSRPQPQGGNTTALLRDYVGYNERAKYRDACAFDLATFLCAPMGRIIPHLLRIVSAASPVYATACATIAAEQGALASLDAAGAAWMREYGGTGGQDRRAGFFAVYLGAHTGHPPKHPGIERLGLSRVDVLAGGFVSVAHLTLSPTVWRALLDAAEAEPTS
jgi:hypothetical protein